MARRMDRLKPSSDATTSGEIRVSFSSDDGEVHHSTEEILLRGERAREERRRYRGHLPRPAASHRRSHPHPRRPRTREPLHELSADEEIDRLLSSDSDSEPPRRPVPLVRRNARVQYNPGRVFRSPNPNPNPRGVQELAPRQSGLAGRNTANVERGGETEFQGFQRRLREREAEREGRNGRHSAKSEIEAAPAQWDKVRCPRFHSLVYLPSRNNDGWACDLGVGALGHGKIDLYLKQRFGLEEEESWSCKSGCNGHYQMQGVPMYTCRICNFDICDKCYDRAAHALNKLKLVAARMEERRAVPIQQSK